MRTGRFNQPIGGRNQLIIIEMKEVKVVGYKEVGFDYNVCDEIYENGCGKDVGGRLLDVEFWKIVFEDRLEWEKNERLVKDINRMVENISKLDGDVLVEF